jgi:hypothetical protein
VIVLVGGFNSEGNVVKIQDLVPGDLVRDPITDEEHTFIACVNHPSWPVFALVIWHLADHTWSHDALVPDFDISGVVSQTTTERCHNLRAALTESLNS